MIERVTKSGLRDYLTNHAHLGGVIINPKREFIYMKPAKTAGTSILRKVLEPQMDAELIHFKKNESQFRDFLSGVSDNALERFFVFAVIRNPWARFISLSIYFGIPFKEFVEKFEQLRASNSELDEHALPLHLYTHNQGCRFADFLCRQECLQYDMNLVFDRIGLGRITIPHANKAKKRKYNCHYDDRAITLVRKTYKKDFEAFGYPLAPDVKMGKLQFPNPVLRKLFS